MLVTRPRRLFTILLVGVLALSSCSSSEQDDFTLTEALLLRRQINNQTGHQHLSLADYLTIGTELCEGAVNDSDRLLTIADEQSIGVFTDDETAATAMWVAAMQICPAVFEDDNEAPPFPSAPGLPPRSIEVDGLPSAFPPFTDIGVLDAPISHWRDGVELGVVSTAEQSASDVLTTLADGLPSGWAAGELVGPVIDVGGFETYSIDVEGNGWKGTMDALDGSPGSFGEPGRTTYVIIFLVPIAS